MKGDIWQNIFGSKNVLHSLLCNAIQNIFMSISIELKRGCLAWVSHFPVWSCKPNTTNVKRISLASLFYIEPINIKTLQPIHTCFIVISFTKNCPWVSQIFLKPFTKAETDFLHLMASIAFCNGRRNLKGIWYIYKRVILILYAFEFMNTNAVRLKATDNHWWL